MQLYPLPRGGCPTDIDAVSDCDGFNAGGLFGVDNNRRDFVLMEFKADHGKLSTGQSLHLTGLVRVGAGAIVGLLISHQDVRDVDVARDVTRFCVFADLGDGCEWSSWFHGGDALGRFLQKYFSNKPALMRAIFGRWPWGARQ